MSSKQQRTLEYRGSPFIEKGWRDCLLSSNVCSSWPRPDFDLEGPMLQSCC